MLLGGLLATCVALALATQALAQDLIVMPAKVFADLGDIVHVEGTVTGQGIGYSNNHTSLTCYKDRHECIVINIESEGHQIFSLGLPGFLDIQIWTSDSIVANIMMPCGPSPRPGVKDHWQQTTSTTWIIDRTRKTANSIQTNCNIGTTYRFSIEEPQWIKMK